MLKIGKHWRIALLGTIISLIAIYFIINQIQLDLLRDALNEARFIYVLPSLALMLLALVMRAFRWRLLLSHAMPLRQTFNIMNIAYMVNNFLPLRIGEVVRVYLASRAKPPVAIFKTTSTIIVERLLDLLAVVLLIAISLFLGPVPEQLRTAGAISGVIGFAAFITLVILSGQRELSHRILDFFLARLPLPGVEKLKNWLDQFLDGLQPLASPATLAGALLWTGISWAFSVAAGYVIMFTFYETPSIAVTCLYIAAAALAIAVPAVPGNLGTYELSILLALGALGFGEPVTVATAFAVTVHAANLLVYTITGIIGFIQEGVSFDQLSQGVQNVAEADLATTEMSNNK